METFFAGQKVRLQYLHSLNSVSKVWRVKEGVALRQMRDRKGQIIHPELILVQVHGNLHPSKVRLSELAPSSDKH